MTGVDLFAGLGGFTEAAKSVGIRILWAANHWQAAVDVHAANHPETAHLCQDLHQADWERVPRMDILLASPSCQGHAKARGKERPHHDAARSTAWAVVSCAEYHRPPVFVVENVPEFLDWSLFPAWKLAMGTLGYAISVNVFDAADAGVPQNRLRAFVIGTRSKNPISIAQPRSRVVPASSIIDWEGWRWSQVDKPGRSKATLARIAAGRRVFGDRFVAPYYGSGSGLTGRSLDRPLGTVTTRDRWAIIDGNKMRMLQVPEYRRAMGFPDTYHVPLKPRHIGIFMLGNAVPPPLAAHVISEVRRCA